MEDNPPAGTTPDDQQNGRSLTGWLNEPDTDDVRAASPDLGIDIGRLAMETLGREQDVGTAPLPTPAAAAPSDIFQLSRELTDLLADYQATAAQQAAATPLTAYLFSLSDRPVAIAADAARLIEWTGPPVPLPGAPAWLRGVVAVEQTPVYLLDPGLLLLNQPAAAGSGRFLLLDDPVTGTRFGLLVDQLRGPLLLTPAPGDVKTAPLPLPAAAIGIYRGAPRPLLDVQRLLRLPALWQAGEAHP